MAFGSTIKGETLAVKGHEKYVRGVYSAETSEGGTINTGLIQTRFMHLQSCGAATGQTIPKPTLHKFPLDTGDIHVTVGRLDYGIWEAWGI